MNQPTDESMVCPRCGVGVIYYRYPPGPFYEVCIVCLKALENEPLRLIEALNYTAIHPETAK